MSMINRIRSRREISRQNRAINKAYAAAPSKAMRDEIAIFAQRHMH